MQQASRRHRRQGQQALYFKLNDADTHAPKGLISPASFPFTKLVFQVTGGMEFIDPGKVVLLKAESNYTQIVESEGRTILLSKTLKQCAHVFPNSFLRVHQSYLINPQYMITYDRKGSKLFLGRDLAIPVSRSGKAVMQAFLAAHGQK